MYLIRLNKSCHLFRQTPIARISMHLDWTSCSVGVGFSFASQCISLLHLNCRCNVEHPGDGCASSRTPGCSLQEHRSWMFPTPHRGLQKFGSDLPPARPDHPRPFKAIAIAVPAFPIAYQLFPSHTQNEYGARS